MAITAFTSTAIIDATTIGTTVLTASSEGIAADAIGLGSTNDVTFNSVNCVDGNFSGTVTANTIAADSGDILYLDGGASTGSVRVLFNTNQRFLFLDSVFRANVDNFATLGIGSRRWSNVYSYDGSFSGNLINEVGSSYKLYNLGTEGDADTEYLETSFVSNVATIAVKKDGSGTARGLTLTSDGTTRIEGSATRLYAGALLALNIFSSTGQFNVNLQPASSGTKFCGSTSRRWSLVGSVDGDFSGTMTLSNLPTSDPAAAGQLWNDSGTVKISSG
jgi:hypothetical protein